MMDSIPEVTQDPKAGRCEKRIREGGWGRERTNMGQFFSFKWVL
jgi:hypothetical protein